MYKKALVIVVIVANILITSGCWGQAELNELGFVMVTGIDYEENGKYRITVMASIPVLGSAQGTDRSSMWIGTATGETVANTARNLRKISFKKLSWVQNKVIVLGKEAAENGLDEILDVFIRNREIRFDNNVLVSEGKAIDLLLSPSDIAKNLYEEISGLILNSQEWTEAYVPDLREFSIAYMNKGAECIAGRIGYNKSKMNTFSAPKEIMMQMEPLNDKHNLVYLYGSSVFKNGKLVGFFDETETKGYMWIMGEGKKSALEITSGDKHGDIVIEVIGSKVEQKPSVVDGEIVIEIKIHTNGRIIENTGNVDFIDDKVIKHLEKEFGKKVENQMMECTYKAQKEYESDVFGIGELIYRKMPNVWREIDSKWNDIYPDIVFKYNIEVTLDRSGEITNAIESKKVK